MPARASNRTYPALELSKAIAMAKAINDEAAGLAVDRLTLSTLLNTSPSSSNFMYMVLSSRAYGLTTGGKNAGEFALTQLGREAVSDDPVARTAALRKAVLSVAPFKTFLVAHDKKKVPVAAAFKAFLANKAAVPHDRLDEAMAHLLADMRTAAFTRMVTGAEWIDLQAAVEARPILDADEENDDEELPAEEVGPSEEDVSEPTRIERPQLLTTPRVFITHGSNRAIVEQLKELLKFGKFEPVVAQEGETVAKPVPEKVFDAMRSCSAAVIHVATEDKLLDSGGQERVMINPNVLIEIGAAMALYGRNFILLVPEGIDLPSNLQGLYRCDYEGEKLDYDATMKLLKAFNDLQAQAEAISSNATD
jgi:predicted nucleotide-binding protein